MLVDNKTVLFHYLGDDTRERIEICTTTTQTTLKLCHQTVPITGLWERDPMVFIGMLGTTEDKLNNVQEKFEAALKTRKKPLAKHM